jgi:hypothetical protein
MFLFRHISRNSVDLVQRKLVPVWGQESRWCLSPLPELTEVLLGGIGEGGVCGLASIFSLVMAWNFGWLAAVYSMLILSPQFGNITFFLSNIYWF